MTVLHDRNDSSVCILHVLEASPSVILISLKTSGSRAKMISLYHYQKACISSNFERNHQISSLIKATYI